MEGWMSLQCSSSQCQWQTFYFIENGGAYMPRQSEQFHPQAVRRLFLAVINQAITDILENKEEAEAAGRWLSSRDFDSFVEPLGCHPEKFRQRLAGFRQEFRSGDPWQDAPL
jgi:hypothetical protein